MAGDIISYDYLKMMIRVAEHFPQISFLAFTKANHTMALLDRALPDNLAVILSAWPGYELVNTNNLPVAWLDDGTDQRIPPGTPLCSGRCDACDICWGMRAGGVRFHKH